MTRRLPFAALAAALLAGGCATYVYQGHIRANDSLGVQREALLYWTRTDPLVGKAKAGPAVLRTACGTPVTYVEHPDAIVFRGTPGQDRLAGQNASVGPNQECGRFLHYRRFVAIGPGNVRLTIHCEPLTDAFSVGRAYLHARPEPYTFPIEVTRHWSLFGGAPDIPTPPACP
jgi:hypothetical protein